MFGAKTTLRNNITGQRHPGLQRRHFNRSRRPRNGSEVFLFNPCLFRINKVDRQTTNANFFIARNRRTKSINRYIRISSNRIMVLRPPHPLLQSTYSIRPNNFLNNTLAYTFPDFLAMLILLIFLAISSSTLDMVPNRLNTCFFVFPPTSVRS